MRLLQLGTDDSSLVELHPNLTVLLGLDDGARTRLVDAVTGLSRGVAAGPGLVEAHGVLFDLTDEMLSMLDVSEGEQPPVVRLEDLPAAPDDPAAQARRAAQRAVSEATERWQAAGEERDRCAAEVDAASDRLEELRGELAHAEAAAAGRIGSVDTPTAELDRAIEQRRRLEEELLESTTARAAAVADLAAVEQPTAAVRAARDDAVARATELAAGLEQARLALVPDAADQVADAIQRLQELEAAVAAEEATEQRLVADALATPAESPADRLARVQARLDEVDQRLATMVSPPVEHVRNQVERLRGVRAVALVPLPEAIDLADQLDALPSPEDAPDVDSPDLAGSRARLDDARHALLEAEQEARNPPLDRAAVGRLEAAHTALLDALDRADSRFGGARAKRQAEQLRADEQVILDQLGFTSYATYMMGSSAQDVDPDKDAALDAARLDLSAAEEAWRAVQARTDAELARAADLDRRRRLVERAQGMLGRNVPAGSAASELRALRVEAAPTGDPAAPLRAALEEAGVDLGTNDLSRADLLLVADAWVEEAAIDADRLLAVASERTDLDAERADAMAELEALKAAAAEPSSSPADERAMRLAAGRQQLAEAEQRSAAHQAAELEVDQARRALDEAAAAEQRARDDAADADAAVAGAQATVDRLTEELSAVQAAHDAAVDAEAVAQRALVDHRDAPGPEAVAALGTKVREATVALEARRSAAAEAEAGYAERNAELEAVAEALDAVHRDGEGSDGDTSVAERIEWYLLARLAAQRSVSLGGSTPLLLDGALAGIEEPDLGRILGRLERMADAVQVILLTDDAGPASWAELAGPARAAVVGSAPG